MKASITALSILLLISSNNFAMHKRQNAKHHANTESSPNTRDTVYQTSGLTVSIPGASSSSQATSSSTSQDESPSFVAMCETPTKNDDTKKSESSTVKPSKKPSTFIKLSDWWSGTEANVRSEVEKGTFSLADLGQAAHRMEWAINEAVKKRSHQDVSLFLNFCHKNDLPINKAFLKTAYEFMQETKAEHLNHLGKELSERSEIIKSIKVTATLANQLGQLGHSDDSDNEDYKDSASVFTKVKTLNLLSK